MKRALLLLTLLVSACNNTNENFTHHTYAVTAMYKNGTETQRIDVRVCGALDAVEYVTALNRANLVFAGMSVVSVGRNCNGRGLPDER